jgi:hypothetical protein
MCVLFINNEHFGDGWGCCYCRKMTGSGTYNGLHRALCKECDMAPCDLDRISGALVSRGRVDGLKEAS